MAQRSLPQAGESVGDSGPYTSDDWAEYFQTVYTGDEQATQGPIRHFLNELEVTEAALTVTTDTGAGFVYGHFIINDIALDITIALAAAGWERYDRVVMVENDTIAVYNTNLALPAAYAAGIPRNSARIAILQGTEAVAAVLPPLLTGPNYYMVELARYLIDDAAAGTVVDYRDYCLGTAGDNRREVFIQPLWSHNVTDDTYPLDPDTNQRAGLDMPADKWCNLLGNFVIPPNYDPAGGITFTAIIPSGNNNIYCDTYANYGQCSEFIDIHSDNTGYSAVAIGNQWNCIQPLTLSLEEAGDIVRIGFARNATHGSDTAFSVPFNGWIAEYTVR